MSINNIFSEFTNVYPVQKTLRFALEPIGKTLENINQKELLEEDAERAKKYKHAKKIIDEYHKWHINEKLKDYRIPTADLENFYKIYSELKKIKRFKQIKKKDVPGQLSENVSAKKEEDLEKEFTKLQTQLRKKISSALKADGLFKKEFIQETLPEWLKNNPVSLEGVENPAQIVQGFNDWTTYFSGFHENRKNVYTGEEKPTSVAFRLIHDNLPKFLDNLANFERAKKLEIDFSPVEKELECKPDEIFSLEGFNQCLTQQGIDSYNLARGGIVHKDESKKKQGINERINLFAQEKQHQLANANDEQKAELKKRIKEIRSCKLVELYKQILSDRSELSYRLDNISCDAELCMLIQGTFVIGENTGFRGKAHKSDEKGNAYEINVDIEHSLKEILKKIEDADPEQIYIKNSDAISNISQAIFKDWGLIKRALVHYMETAPLSWNKNGEPKKMSEQEQKKWLKKGYFSFAEIHTALESYIELFAGDELQTEPKNMAGITQKIRSTALSRPLCSYFKNHKIRVTGNQNTEQETDLFTVIKETYQELMPVLDSSQNESGEVLKSQPDRIKIIKAYLDAVQQLFHFFRPLFVQQNPADEKKVEVMEKDAGFYADFDEVYESLRNITSLYNRTRNYLTKKPYSIEKYKLNFENSTLAAGWDKNKERDNTCILMLRNDQYYLTVLNKKHNKLFAQEPLDNSGECYKKIEYKLLPGASKMLPKVFFSNKNIDYYTPSKEILRIRNTGSHTKAGKPQPDFEKAGFDLNDCRAMISFYINSIKKHPEWQNFNFEFQSPSSYQSIDEFYREVEHQGYKISFVDVSENYIHKCVEEGKLFLFRIYSKDFSPRSKGKPGLQTLYWKALFDSRNLTDVIYKLNGEAELFYRRASLEYSENVWKTGHHANDPQKTLPYPIIKDRRYAQNTFLFHVPISCNFKAGNEIKFNSRVNAALKNNPDIKIIGIDRGERHLAYYTLINQKREIIEQGTLNTIESTTLSGEKKTTDYHSKLDDLEVTHKKARKTWTTIGKIKDMKEGYLSQVVHKLVSMMLEHRAIIVFEDLNFGFKRGRFKVEKQVYQKLEKMLIDKLNFLVHKSKNVDEPAGLYNPLQLTAPFKSFNKLGKQTGFIYYVPAYHTSKVCPATGFVNLLYPRYETIQKAREFFRKFESVSYNKAEDLFEFTFDYDKFPNTKGIYQKTWMACSYGKRLINFRNKDKQNQWDTKEIDPTLNLKNLFKKYGIDYENGNIKEKISAKAEADFFRSLISSLKQIFQLRNSRTGTDEDWMISPVRDKNGQFFDSRLAAKEMPQNADANGAYHIALKGLMILQQMKEAQDIEKFGPALDNKLWYQFIQEKET